MNVPVLKDSEKLKCPACSGEDFYPVEVTMKEVTNGTEGNFSCSLCNAKLVVFVNMAGFTIRVEK